MTTKAHDIAAVIGIGSILFSGAVVNVGYNTFRTPTTCEQKLVPLQQKFKEACEEENSNFAHLGKIYEQRDAFSKEYNCGSFSWICSYEGDRYDILSWTVDAKYKANFKEISKRDTK